MPTQTPLTTTEKPEEGSVSNNEHTKNSSMGAAGSSSMNFEDCETNTDRNTDNDRSLHNDWDIVRKLPRLKNIEVSLPLATMDALRLADALVTHTKHNNVIDESDVACFDCHLFPELPVTGPCGHTRCFKCITDNGACSCGVPHHDQLFINTLVQDLVEKLLKGLVRPSVFTDLMKRHQVYPEASTSQDNTWKLLSKRACTRLERSPYASHLTVICAKPQKVNDASTLIPMTFEARFSTARELACTRRYYEAVPLLAHVAVSSDHNARDARLILNRVIAALLVSQSREDLTRQLFRMVQQYAVSSCLSSRELQCPLCCSPFNKPVTTPCGHNFCFTCLEQCMDYNKCCPLCKRSLVDFNIFTTKETRVVTAALRSLNAVPPPILLEANEIRLLVCTVAYPGVSCPLYLLGPACWLLVRRVLEEDRRFGMLAHQENDGTTCSIGTILEIRDCIQLANGRSIISTVGISRFRVLDRDTKDGCEVARYEPFIDIQLPNEAELTLELTFEVACKALGWINELGADVLEDIENTFGKKPHFQCGYTSARNDGPMWLWWIISILPIRIEVKLLLLTSADLVKRLLAVSCTFDAIAKAPELNDLTNMLAQNINQEDIHWLNMRLNNRD